MSEEEAFSCFVAIRFSENGGKPFCPWCGHREVYSIPTRMKWKCASRCCRRQFSATSQTIFASRKLPFGDLLLLMAHFVNELKGLTAIRLTQQLEIHYKSAFVRLHKLREVLETHQQANDLRGKVEIDGAYFGGHARPKNNRPSRVDRRRLRHRTGKRQCVVIMRERFGRSRPFIMSESEAAAIAHEVIEPGSEVYTDEGKHWIRLAARYVLHMVNHSEHYSDGDKCTNWAESYFARLRRAELGIHHHIAGPHFAEYANEISWREDRRRYSNLENFQSLARQATRHPVSRKWKGYWQRRKAA
jgi:hypothetical protein